MKTLRYILIPLILFVLVNPVSADTYSINATSPGNNTSPPVASPTISYIFNPNTTIGSVIIELTSPRGVVTNNTATVTNVTPNGVASFTPTSSLNPGRWTHKAYLTNSSSGGLVTVSQTSIFTIGRLTAIGEMIQAFVSLMPSFLEIVVGIGLLVFVIRFAGRIVEFVEKLADVIDFKRLRGK